MTNDELFQELDKLAFQREKSWLPTRKEKLDAEILKLKIELTNRWNPNGKFIGL